MRVTQGTFSFLPDLTDAQIERQIAYAISRGWALSIEHTDDAHPRNVFWEMWGPPMFDLREPSPVMVELRACRAANPDRYVKVNAFDSTRGWETVRLSFIVQRPKDEPGFGLVREEGPGRVIRYSIRGYAAEKPPGRRYA